MTDKKNGCFDRKAFVSAYLSAYGQVIKNFSAGKPCEYTHSDLGQADKGCIGCKWRKEK